MKAFIVAIILALSSSGYCADVKAKTNDIIGTWYTNVPRGQYVITIRSEIIFKNDGTYISKHVDRFSDGFTKLYQETGEYTLIDGILKIRSRGKPEEIYEVYINKDQLIIDYGNQKLILDRMN